MNSLDIAMPDLPDDSPLVEAYPISLGTLNVPHSSLFASGNGTTITTPLVSVLLIVDGRPIIVDNGYDVSYLPRFTFENTLEQHALENGLREHGLTYDDVEIVINTHLHSDHGGMNRVFRGARIVVQADEYAYAFRPDETMKFAYRPTTGHRGVPPERFDLLTGNAEVAPGVWVVRTPGHTPGHQAVVARTASGWVVLPGDVAHARSIWEGEDRTALIHDHASYERSREVLQSTGFIPLFSHDLEWMHDGMKASY